MSLYEEGILVKSDGYSHPFPDLLTFQDANTVIEQRLFVMHLKHRMRAFQGTFHANPDYALWYGWSELVRDLGPRDLPPGIDQQDRHEFIHGFEFDADPVLQVCEVVLNVVDIAHDARARSTRPLTKSRISEGPEAGPQSPGTT